MDIVTLALAKSYADSIGSGITNITTENNKLIFTLQNGNTIEVPLTDLVDNVVTEEELLDKLKDYIKNTDFASAEKAGVIKVDAVNYATEVNNGKLRAFTKTYENYKNMTDAGIVGKGTLENVITGKNLETANNKVTFVDEDSTDEEYPSAKVMYKVSNKLDTLKDEVLDTGEASDTFIHLEDSSMSELQELEIEGVCQQETTSGSNLCNLNVAQDSRVTINSDGTITINGSGGFNLKYSSYKFKANTNYYVKWELISGQATTYQTFFAPNEKIWTEKDKFVNFNYDSDTTSSGMWIHADAKFTNAVIKIWFSETQSDFEPYTGGIASPSPDYPQEIKTITGNLNLISCGKNLLKAINYSNTHNGINYIFNNNSVSAKGTSTSQSISIDSRAAIKNGFLSILDKGKYVLKISSSNAIVELVNESGNMIVKTFSSNSVTKFELKEPTKYFYRIVVPKNTTVDETFYLQLEKGEEGTAIEEQHISSQVTANLPENEFIGKIDDTYKDTLNIVYNEEEGQYHLMLRKVVSKFTIDENTNLVYGANDKYSNYTVQIELNNLSQNIKNKVLSTSFTYTYNNWSNDLEGICVGGNNSDRIQIKIKSSRLESNTLVGFKKWLSKNPIEVYYPLAESYELDLGPIEMPLSYNEITNIFTDSDLLPKINATYYRNFKKTVQNLQVNNDTLKNELMNIEDRLTALENANVTTANAESTTDESEETE